MSSSSTIPPPLGYASWLDYAVEELDTRSVQLQTMFETGKLLIEREAIRAAARNELLTLRQAAAAQGPAIDPAQLGSLLDRFDPERHGGEVMAVAPVGAEFGSLFTERLAEKRRDVSELQGMTGPAMKSWMDRHRLNAKLAGIVEVCAEKYTDEHHPFDPEERSLAINVQTALRELGHDVSVTHAAAVWEYHSATMCAAWMLGAETVDGAIVALVSLTHFAS